MHPARRLSMLAPLALVVAGLAACGGSSDKSAAEVKEDVSAQLVNGGQYDLETADCLAGVIVDEVGAKVVQDVNFNDEAPDDELAEELVAAVQQASETCLSTSSTDE